MRAGAAGLDPRSSADAGSDRWRCGAQSLARVRPWQHGSAQPQRRAGATGAEARGRAAPTAREPQPPGARGCGPLRRTGAASYKLLVVGGPGGAGESPGEQGRGLPAVQPG